MTTLRHIISPKDRPEGERPEPVPTRAVSETFNGLNRLFKNVKKGDSLTIVYVGEGKVHVVVSRKEAA